VTENNERRAHRSSQGNPAAARARHRAYTSTHASTPLRVAMPTKAAPQGERREPGRLVRGRRERGDRKEGRERHALDLQGADDVRATYAPSPESGFRPCRLERFHPVSLLEALDLCRGQRVAENNERWTHRSSQRNPAAARARHRAYTSTHTSIPLRVAMPTKAAPQGERREAGRLGCGGRERGDRKEGRGAHALDLQSADDVRAT
jgi:hypothetical protein